MVNKQEQNLKDFLALVNDNDKEFVIKVNEIMMTNNATSKVEHRKTFSVINYKDSKTKKVITSVTIKKEKLSVKIVGYNAMNYESFLEELPTTMVETIETAPDCKRMIDPSTCWQACEMGTVFNMNGVNLAKCRYHCFEFDVESANKESIYSLVETESRYHR